MKKILFFLLPLLAIAQAPEIGGQAIFYPTQWDTYAERVLDGYTISGRSYDEGAKIIAQSAIFYNEVTAGNFAEAGRWGNFHNTTAQIPRNNGDGIYEPHSYRSTVTAGESWYPRNTENESELINYAALMMLVCHKADENFVDASTYTLVDGSRQMTWNGSSQTLTSIRDQLASVILDELIWLADSDAHDASNGGSLDGTSTYYDGSSRPARTNATHGTFERFLFNVTSEFGTSDGARTSSPWWISMAKMSKLTHVFGALKEVYSADATFIANEDKIGYWFKDWVAFCYESMNFIIEDNLGSGWRSFTLDSYPSGGSTLDGNGNRQEYAYYNNDDGTGGVFRTYANLWDTFNNRENDHWEFMHTYATYFGDTFLQPYMEDWWVAQYATYVDTNGTILEFYRGGDGVPSHQYVHINITQLSAMAHSHGVAVVNGFANVTDARKYYDLTTTLGSNDLYATNPVTNTGDGVTEKGLELVMNFTAETWQEPANGGYRNAIYDEVGNGYPESKTNTNSISFGMSNLYYDTPLLEAANVRDGSLGFTDGYTDHGSGAFSGEWGQAWFIAGAMGGQLATYDMGGVAETDIAAFEAGGGGTTPTTTKKREENVTIN